MIRQIAAAVALTAVAGSGWAAYAIRPADVHIVRQPVVRTVTVTAPPKVVRVIKWRTRTVVSDAKPAWYQTYGGDPEWRCIIALVQRYVALAQGGPAGNAGMFQTLCPDVPNMPTG